jgi:phosphohistidine phosphatase
MLDCRPKESDAALGKRPIFSETGMTNGEFFAVHPQDKEALMKSAAAAHRLMLLRHAKALKSQPGERDFDRELAARGMADSEKLGAFLTRHRLVPDRVVVSPATRASDTWARAAITCPKAPPPVSEPRLYDAKPETILDIVKAIEGANRVLIVGHNPGLHELALLLIASGDVEIRERLQENLPTAGLVVIDFAVKSWAKLHRRSGRLELFVEPRTLDAMVQ